MRCSLAENMRPPPASLGSLALRQTPGAKETRSHSAASAVEAGYETTLQLPSTLRGKHRAAAAARSAEPAPGAPAPRLGGSPPDPPGFAGKRSESSRERTTACRSSPCPQPPGSCVTRLHFVEKQTSASRLGPERRHFFSSGMHLLPFSSR